MAEKIKTYIYRVGDVVFLTDKQTKTVGHHPYVILSDVSNDTYEVICMGMTSCSHKDTYNVIPVESPDGKISYIIPNQVFRYSVRDISEGKYAFSLDFEFATKLRMYYLSKIGMSACSIDSEIYSLFVDVIHDGETIKHGSHSIGYRIPGESSPNPLKRVPQNIYKEQGIKSHENIKVKPEKHDKSTEDCLSSYDLTALKNPPNKWTDEQIRFAHSAMQIRGGKTKLAGLLDISHSTIYRYRKIIANEFDKRGLAYLPSIKWENNPFDKDKKEETNDVKTTVAKPVDTPIKNKTKEETKPVQVQSEEIPKIPDRFSKKTKYDVKFWEVSDLLRYRQLYNSHSYEILKSELGLDKSKQISIFSSVQTRLDALGMHK